MYEENKNIPESARKLISQFTPGANVKNVT